MKARMIIAVLALSFLAFSIASIPMARVSAQITTQNLTTVNVTQTLNMTASPHYSLFSLNAVAGVSYSVSFNFSGTSNGTSVPNFVLSSPLEIDIRLSFSPGQIIASAFVNNSLTFLTARPLAAITGGLVGYFVILPQGTINSTILFEGTQKGEYLLGQYVSSIPRVFLSSPSGLVDVGNPTTNLFLPDGSVISAAYGQGSASAAGPAEPVPPSTTAPSGQLLYKVPPPVVVVIMHSKLFVPLSILVTTLAVILIAFTSLGFFTRGLRLINGIFERIIQLSRKLQERVFGLLRIRRARGFPWRRVFRSKNLLILFILCGLLMVSLAALTGPDPSIRAFVIAPPQETSQIQSTLHLAIHANVETVTPSQDFTDFDVMSNVGMFKVLVVSDYPAPALLEISKFIVPNARNVPIIVVTPTADPNFVSQLKGACACQTINLTDTSGLVSAYSQAVSANALGLRISNSSFRLVVAIEGGLSFLLVLFGWAYLGAKATEPGVEKTLTNIAYMILSGVFIFQLSEVLYVATSAILNFPLSLHAVISGAQNITAVGVLGAAIHLPFGGGSTPRMIIGILGILIGAFASEHNRMFSKRALGLIVGVLLIAIANPLELGKITFQGLLLFVGNVSLGSAFTSALTVKGFLYGIGSAVGGNVTPVYLMSAGKMLYFAGLVPLAFIKKMGRGSTTFTILLCAAIVGDGGVRVGEMTPDKTVIAVLPGLIAGVVILMILLLVAALERYLTTTYVRSRP